MSQSLYEKLFSSHVVAEEAGQALLYIDRHLVHEVTSPQAFSGLLAEKRKLWRPAMHLAVADHNVPTLDRASGIKDPVSRAQVEALEKNCRDFGIPCFSMGDSRQGIVHVVGPETGFTLPGTTVVCGDSHTSTHGALAALAFGIGTSDIEHVLATQCLWVKPAKTMRVVFTGMLPQGVGAKDMALALISAIGTAGATGHAIEFAGEAVKALSVEGRMTLCNMAIEAGARSGLVGVDDKTIAYLKDRPLAPQGEMWERAHAFWRTLVSDAKAVFAKEVVMDCASLSPYVTWGTSPEMALPVQERTPDPEKEPDPQKRAAMGRALAYMGLSPGTALQDITVDKVFIGSCTNSRLEDLREAAKVVQGKTVHPRVRLALVVPGSGLVKAQAEKEGLHEVFLEAGFSWREPGCSMCLGMNEDRLLPQERCASTSNRNFEGRQGPGGRTHLMSPAMAAAAAISGRIADVRRLP